MGKRGRRLFLWSNMVLMVLSFAGIILDEFVKLRLGNLIFIISVQLFVLSLSYIIAIVALKYESSRWFNRIARLFSCILPVCILVILAPPEWIYVNTNLGNFLLTSGTIISLVSVVVSVFILSKPDAIGGLLVIISYVILTLILKQIYKFGTTEAIGFGMLIIGPGMNIFGLRIFLIAERNHYLKIITLLAGILILMTSIQLIWLTSTQNNIMMIIDSVLIFLFTVIVLISLPGSGYFEWEALHKRIFKKLLIPWIFILLVVSVRFIFPDLNNLFFKEKPNEHQEFYMKDYEISDKNGLEPE